MVIESVSKLLHIGQHPLTLQIYVCPLPPSSLCQPTHELSRNVCPTKKGMRSHKHTSACHCLHTKISPSHYNTAPWFIPRQPSLFLQQNLLCVSSWMEHSSVQNTSWKPPSASCWYCSAQRKHSSLLASHISWQNVLPQNVHPRALKIVLFERL